jgi:hypothetical protein
MGPVKSRRRDGFTVAALRIMAIKTWETDFRYPAIQASIRALSDAGRDDPFSHPGSFCLPAGRKPFVGWTRGRFVLIMMCLCLALGIAGVLIIVIGALLNAQGPIGYALAILVMCCWFAGSLTAFSPFVFYDRIIRWLIGERADALLRRSPFARVTGAEVFDGAKSRMALLMSTGEGALLFFDEQNRRVMIEGDGARYQIRAADVEEVSRVVWQFPYGRYVGARITYLIDSETRLQLLILRYSIMPHYLPWFILEAMPWLVSNKVFENSLRTLQPADVSAVQEAPST